MTRYELASAVMKDAANASARKNGRAAWNEDDYNAGVAEFQRICPLDSDYDEVMVLHQAKRARAAR